MSADFDRWAREIEHAGRNEQVTIRHDRATGTVTVTDSRGDSRTDAVRREEKK